MPHIDALREAIAIVRGQANFALLVGKSQQLVSYWITSGKGLPAEKVLLVEERTGVPRWRLRPDIYPPHLGPGPAAKLSPSIAA